MSFDSQPLWLTLKVASLSTAILLVLSLPLSFWLARRRSLLRELVRILCNLPLVLPPTVVGFCLLLLFSPGLPTGQFLSSRFGIEVLFTAKALVIGSVVGGIPFMVGPLAAGIEALPPSLAEASWVLGKSRAQTLLRVLLPALRPAILAGTVTTFAHACGEFGVVLMVGGKIPGVTQTASIALYDAVESMDFALAAKYAGALALLSVSVLWAVQKQLSSREVRA